MASSSSSSCNPASCSGLTVLVLGDSAVGKTSLISSLVSESFNARVPPVLQGVMVPPALMPERAQLTIVDTSSDPQHRDEAIMHLAQTAPSTSGGSGGVSGTAASLLADCVLLVVAADVPDSFARVETYWLPLIESHSRPQGRIPVVIAVNKSAPEDATAATAAAHEMHSSDYLPTAASSSALTHLLSGYRVSAVLPCSAKTMLNVSHVFFACTKVILSPVEPLFDLHPTRPATQSQVQLQPATMKFKLLTQQALLRVHRLFDSDKDGALNFAELDALHRANFAGKRLAAVAFEQLCRWLLNRGPHLQYVQAVDTHGPGALPLALGVTFSGLLYMHTAFLLKDRHLFNTWRILEAFGYQQSHQQQVQSSMLASAAQGQVVATGAAAPATPSLVRGHSSTGSTGTAGAAAALSATGIPPMGSLTLREDYCSLGFPFQPSLAYELSPIAIDFLTSLFHTFASDGHLSLRFIYGNDALNPAVSATSNHGGRASSSSAAVTAAAAICSLAAHSDLESLFLTCPDIPFSLSTFTKFVGASPLGSHFLTLDAWLACWALLLYNFSTSPTAMPVGGPTSSTAALTTPAAVSAASNLSASFTTCSPVAAPSSAAASPAAPVPNPDIILRYFAYLCFPVAPAQPEFSLTMDSHGRSKKTYLPRLQRCLHLTPRVVQNRTAIDAAIACNESILSSDPTTTSTTRSQLAEPSAWKPRTVCCFVVGSAGSGKSSFIDAFLGVPPNASALAQPVAHGVIPGLGDAGGRTHSHSLSQSQVEAAAVNSETQVSTSSSSQQHPRIFANRLPLSHVPVMVPSSSGRPQPAPTPTGDSNQFMLLKDIPSSLGCALLASSAFTASTCNLVLVVCDGTSRASFEYARTCLRTCFEKRIPALVVQTKVDCADCAPADFRSSETDLNVHVEAWSARAFWTDLQRGQPTQFTSVFQRVFQAAQQPSGHVLSLVSTAARSSQLVRRLLYATLLATTAVLAGAVFWRSKTVRALLAQPTQQSDALSALAVSAAESADLGQAASNAKPPSLNAEQA